MEEDMGKLRIALIGAYQVHADKFVRLAHGYEESEVVAVWAETPELAAEHAAIVGNCRQADSWEEILADPSVDGVIVMTAPAEHTKYLIAAAEAGKHIYVEKTLCFTEEEAAEVSAAVKKSGVTFMMADPIVRPQLAYIRKQIEDGAIGPVVNARCRISFDQCPGEKKYDPAIIDRICALGGSVADSHTQHMLEYLLGRPLRVSSMMQKDPSGRTNINSVSIYEFENGALGVAEACVRTGGCPYEVEVYGETGSYAATKDAVYYLPIGGNWEKVPAEDLPEPQDYILHQWIMHIVNGTQSDVYGIDGAVRVVAMQNSARKAAELTVPVE